MRQIFCPGSPSGSTSIAAPVSGPSWAAKARRCSSCTASAARPGTSRSCSRTCEGRRLIVPDLPGHGGSAPLPATPTLRGFADALVPLLDGPTDVLGHSLGGVVALRLAERQPALVRRARARGGRRDLQLDPPCRAARSPSWASSSPGGSPAGASTGSRARARLRRLVFGPFEVSNPDLLSERAVHGFLRGPLLHTDAIGAGAGARRRRPAARPRAGALPGARALGRPRPPGAARATASSTPAACARRLRVIADCGHLLIGERPGGLRAGGAGVPGLAANLSGVSGCGAAW